jgi:hypothetical protein
MTMDVVAAGIVALVERDAGGKRITRHLAHRNRADQATATVVVLPGGELPLEVLGRLWRAVAIADQRTERRDIADQLSRHFLSSFDHG